MRVLVVLRYLIHLLSVEISPRTLMRETVDYGHKFKLRLCSSQIDDSVLFPNISHLDELCSESLPSTNQNKIIKENPLKVRL